MKSKELIKQLQKLDPEGNCEVFGDGDIYFCDRLPWYYDGKPGILIRDESKKPYYHVAGMRQIKPEDGDKIYIYTMTLDDVVCDGHPDDIFEGDESFMKNVAERKKYWKEWEDNMKKGDFLRYCEQEYEFGRDHVESFWEANKDKLMRDDFNMFKTCIHDKRVRWFKDCVDVQDSKLVYIPGFEDKNYNE
jgi:hypothetical protein